jgi:hypothetical protein
VVQRGTRKHRPVGQKHSKNTVTWHKGAPGNTVKWYRGVPENTGQSAKNTVKWHKGVPENTVKWFRGVPENTVKWYSGVPENTGQSAKNTVKCHKGVPENTVKWFRGVPENTGQSAMWGYVFSSVRSSYTTPLKFKPRSSPLRLNALVEEQASSRYELVGQRERGTSIYLCAVLM